MRELLVAIAIVVGGLTITNPDRAEYLDWVQHQGSSDPLHLLVMSLARPFVDTNTKAENFLVFTIFTTAIDATHNVRTVGLAHRFMPVVHPEEPWRPGTRSKSHPHVIAAKVQDQWLPEPGYRWINEPPLPGDLRVKWVAGTTEATFPHVVTSAAEGRWLPEDGYDWVTQPPKPGDMRVRWMQGKASSLHQHVVAALQEARWVPEQGFVWLTDPPPAGEFRVKRVSPDEATGLPKWRGVTLRQCSDRDHFAPDTPCWFKSDNGIYVASKFGNMRSSTFAQWPNVDAELTGLDPSTVLAPIVKFSREQLGAMLAKCSVEADERGLFVDAGFAEARRSFRRECMSKIGVEPIRR